MPLGELVAIIGTCAVFAVPITAIVTSHQRKMAELKTRVGIVTDGGSVLNDVKNDITALRREVASLRDTSTTFDVSFDAAISRLEQRVDRIEDAKTVSTPLHTAPPTRTDEEHIILGQKG